MGAPAGVPGEKPALIAENAWKMPGTLIAEPCLVRAANGAHTKGNQRMNTTTSRIASRRSPLAAALLALAASTGCAYDADAPLDEELASTDEAITNAPADGPHYVVNLGGCSGVAISANYILTAAHCFNTSSFFAVTVKAGLFSETVAFAGTAQVVVHPSWSPSAADRDANDIAIVRLFGAGLGTGFERARIYAGPETPWTTKGNGFYMAGYGRGTGSGGARNCSSADAGGVVKRGGNFAFLGTGRKSGSTWLSVNGYSSLRTTCNGDSGAPYILPRNGVDFAFAIHSGSTNTAGGTMRATMIQPKLSWIQANAAAMGVPLACSFVRDHRTSPAMHYFDCR